MHHLETQDPAEVSAFLVIAVSWCRLNPLPFTKANHSQLAGRRKIPAKHWHGSSLFIKIQRPVQVFRISRRSGHHTYLRLDANPAVQIPSKLDISELTLEALVEAAREVFSNPNNLPPLSEVVASPRFTIRQKIHIILEALQKMGATTFQQLITTRSSRVEVVVTFLALLELVKRHMVGADQNQLFGEISLQPEGEFSTLDDQELEFVE